MLQVCDSEAVVFTATNEVRRLSEHLAPHNQYNRH